MDRRLGDNYIGLLDKRRICGVNGIRRTRADDAACQDHLRAVLFWVQLYAR